jgi:hypothetical protein
MNVVHTTVATSSSPPAQNNTHAPAAAVLMFRAANMVLLLLLLLKEEEATGRPLNVCVVCAVLTRDDTMSMCNRQFMSQYNLVMRVEGGNAPIERAPWCFFTHPTHPNTKALSRPARTYVYQHVIMTTLISF